MTILIFILGIFMVWAIARMIGLAFSFWCRGWRLASAGLMTVLAMGTIYFSAHVCIRGPGLVREYFLAQSIVYAQEGKMP